jgi:glycosyltransferase involved in cell wall biosynthesis
VRTRNLRVAIVVPRFSPFTGGVEIYTQQAAQALGTTGAEVTVITQAPRRSILPVIERGGEYFLERHRLPFNSSYDMPSLSAVRAATRPGRFDVIWAHSYHTPLAWLVAECATTPVVLTPHYHGTGHTRLRTALHRPYRLAGRRMLGRCRSIVAVTSAEAELLRKDFPNEVCDERLNVVLPAVRAHYVTDDLSGASKDTTILTVARQERYKRTDLLIRATAELRHRGLSVHLVAVGGGSALEALRGLTLRLGLGDCVTLTGPVNEDTLRRCWASAHLYATASEQEAFGNSLAQALASGLPVVASALPAHREVVSCSGPASAAELVETATSEESTALRYAEAIERLLLDTSSRAQRARLCTLPSQSDMARQLIDIFSRAAA